MWELKCLLDIGNGYIKWVLILKEQEWSPTVIAREMVKTLWFKKWRILDGSSFIQVIQVVIDNLAKKVDTWIDEVIIGISHPDMKIKKLTANKRLLQIDIQEQDAESLLQNISDLSWEVNYEVLKIIPVNWIVDNELKVKDPIWMQWRNLELVANVFMVPVNFYRELEKIFDQIDIDIVDVVPNILWAEEAVLDAEIKDLWCLLIDIWANQTSFVIYEDWLPLYYWVVPIWWEEITKDISIWLQIDYKEAEKIKKEKWTILMWESIEDEQLDMWFLSEIISARCEDIFSYILEKMEQLWVDSKLPWWTVIIWGGAKIKNIQEFAKQYFKLSSKLWEVLSNKFWDLWANPQFINIIWDYLWEDKYWGMINRWLNIDFGIFKKISDFFKKLF